MLVLCIFLLALTTVPPLINLGRFQRRIAGAISRSIGRPVSMDSISLRLLPWPAFRIRNLAIGEEPGFGAEPALRAPEVIAEPRLSSLWRGRVELDRVEIADASVNLVRDEAGRWNISSVLLKASQIPNAPTAQSRPGPAPRFPYIEATGTRINFKRGVEKLPYSLLNADFSMYLGRPELWRLKLEGQPVRTDLELSTDDTGTVRLQGELHRASALGTMPLSMQGEWSHAPLGQISRILLGRDAGWRGDIDLTAQFEGEIDHLDVSSHLLVAGLHRQEFTPEQPFTVDATCRGHYSRSNPLADAFRCRWPLGDGSLLLAHGAGEAPGDLTVEADKLPAGAIAAAVALLRPNAPEPGRFHGDASGRFSWNPDGGNAAAGQLAGFASVPTLSIAGAKNGSEPLVLSELRITPGTGPQPSLSLTSEPVTFGDPATAIAITAELSGGGYRLHANGTGTLPALQAAASTLRLEGLGHLSVMPADAPADASAKQATAQLALTLSGRWLGETASSPENAFAGAEGTVHFRNVRWAVPWLPSPVDFPSLDAALLPGSIRWSTPSALLGTGPTPQRFSGSAQVSLACDPGTPCVQQFSLSTPSLDAGLLARALHPQRSQLLSAFFDRLNPLDEAGVHPPSLAGTVHAGVFTLGRLPIRNASLVISTEMPSEGGPVIHFESLDGQSLGGDLHLKGALRFSNGIPHYAVHASLTGASAAQAAALWHENWGPGTLGGTADLELAGAGTADLLGSVKGSFQALWQHGRLPPALPEFTSWDASGSLTPSGLRLEHGTLSPTPATVTGSLGWDRSLHLQLLPSEEESSKEITGTLGAPLVHSEQAAPDAGATP